MEKTMSELVTEKECDIRHKRIDEHLEDGKETMTELVKLTTKMDKTLGIIEAKLDRIKNNND